MTTIPTTLSPEQAEEITKLLQDARKYLRDAMGMKSYEPSYASTSVRIAEMLRRFEIDAD